MKFSELFIRTLDNRFQIDSLFLNYFPDKLDAYGTITPTLLTVGQEFLPPIKNLSFELELSALELKIGKLDIQSDRGVYQATGIITEKNNDLLLDTQTNYQGKIIDLPYLAEQAPLFKKIGGDCNVLVKLHGTLSNIEANYAFSGTEVVLPWARFDKVLATGEMKQKKIFIAEFKAEHKDARLALKNKFEILDLEKMTLPRLETTWDLTKVKLEEALAFLGDDVSFLAGELTGQAQIVWAPASRDLSFYVGEQFQVENFAIVNKKNKSNIIRFPTITLRKGSVDIQKLRRVLLNFDLTFPNSELTLTGEIFTNVLDIRINASKLDLEKIGKIANLDFRGVGSGLVSIVGSDKTIIDIRPNLNDFVFEGYSLGMLTGQMVINLDQDRLTIIEAHGKRGETTCFGKGYIDWKKQTELSLDIRFDNATFVDSQLIYRPLATQIEKIIPGNTDFNYFTEYHVGGSPEKKINVTGKMLGKNFQLYQEEFDSISLSFNYDGDILKINDVNFKKNLGRLRGSFSYDFANKYLEYDFGLERFALKDSKYYQLFNGGLEGDIYGEFYANGTINDFSSRSQIRLVNARVSDLYLPDSSLTVYNNPKDIFVNGNFFGSRVTLGGSANIDKKSNGKSFFNVNVDLEDIRIPLGIVSAHNVHGQNLDGKIKFQANTEFNWRNWQEADLNIEIKEFVLKKGKMSLNLNGERNKFILKKGRVEQGELSLVDGADSLHIIGTGELMKKFRVQGEYNLDANIWEVLTPKVQSANGKIHGLASVSYTSNKLLFEHQSSGNDISVRLENFPATFENIKYNISLDDNVWTLSRLQGQFGRGQIDASGKMIVKYLFPTMDFTVRFDNVFIPLFKKSSITTSGRLALKGDNPPYRLVGNVLLANGELADELDQFASSKSEGDYQRFLPAEGQGNIPALVDASISV
ncbi:MAG: hypothetical protein WCG27_07625, partial [Pseudomonadota bacterium]